MAGGRPILNVLGRAARSLHALTMAFPFRRVHALRIPLQRKDSWRKALFPPVTKERASMQTRSVGARTWRTKPLPWKWRRNWVFPWRQSASVETNCAGNMPIEGGQGADHGGRRGRVAVVPAGGRVCGLAGWFFRAVGGRLFVTGGRRHAGTAGTERTEKTEKTERTEGEGGAGGEEGKEGGRERSERTGQPGGGQGMGRVPLQAG